MISCSDTERGRGRILNAALSLFATRGFDRVTTRDIGRMAGITSPALYRHYGSKDALGVDLYRRCYARTVETALRSASVATPLARLQAYVIDQVALYESEPLVVLYVDEHQQRFWPQIKAEFEPRTLSALVCGWLAAGRTDGTINTSDEIEVQAALVLGLTSQWVAMRRSGLAARDATANLPDLVHRALAAN